MERFRFGAAVIRNPVLPASEMERLMTSDLGDLEEAVRDLISRPQVSEALLLASPSLFARAAMWLEGGGEFNEIYKVVARYLIRMSYRSTPFGTFSCVSSWNIDHERIGVPTLPARARMGKYVTLDSTVIHRLAKRARVREGTLIKLYPNDTLVEAGQDYSYLVAGIARPRRPTPYKKVLVERTKYLDAAINIARGGATSSEIVDALRVSFAKESDADISGFVDEVIDQQILVSDQLHRLIAIDPLLALQQSIPEGSELGVGLMRVRRAVDRVRNDDWQGAADALKSVRAELSEFITTDDIVSVVKVDLCAQIDCLDVGACGEFAEVIGRLETVLTEACSLSRHRNLAGFCERFESRFGGAELPLSHVADILDSLGFDRRVVQAPLAKAVLGTSKPVFRKAAAPVSLDPLGLAALALKNDLYIDATDLLCGRQDPVAPQLTDLLVTAALWEVGPDCDERPGSKVLEIRGVGVGDPRRVYGRFTNALPSLRTYVEARAGKNGRVPVELVHLPRADLGNILSRADLGSLQLGIRSGVPAEKSIPISDVMVRVRDGEVLLRSVRLNQDIELRMSNAHAFDTSPSIPMYRFLASVANQSYEARLPRLRSLAPMAPFVPGICHRGVILSRASWHLSLKECEALRRMKRADAVQRIKRLRDENRWPNPIALTQADRVTPFNLDLDWMVEELLVELRKLNGADFIEVYPNKLIPALRSEDGRHFNELQLPLFRGAGRSPADGSATAFSARDVVRQGWGEWMYLRIYADALAQNAVIRVVAPLLVSAASRAEIDEFFFLRYVDDRGEHLRLRVRTKGATAAGVAWSLLGGAFAELGEQGVIHSVNSDDYVREIYRYGGERNCSVCEEIFYHDSVVISEILSGSPDDSMLWKICARLMDDMLGAIGLADLESKLAFARAAAASFQRELGLGKAERSRIGGVFRLLPRSYAEFIRTPINLSQVATDSAARISECWGRIEHGGLKPGDVYRVRWSLIHMRVNRLLSSGARTEEAILWDILRRMYDRESAMVRQCSSGALV